MISKSGLFNLQSSNSSFVCPLQNCPCWEHSTYFFTNLCIIVWSVQRARLLWNLWTKFSSSVAPQVIPSFSRLCRLKNISLVSSRYQSCSVSLTAPPSAASAEGFTIQAGNGGPMKCWCGVSGDSMKSIQGTSKKCQTTSVKVRVLETSTVLCSSFFGSQLLQQ